MAWDRDAFYESSSISLFSFLFALLWHHTLCVTNPRKMMMFCSLTEYVFHPVSERGGWSTSFLSHLLWVINSVESLRRCYLRFSLIYTFSTANNLIWTSSTDDERHIEGAGKYFTFSLPAHKIQFLCVIVTQTQWVDRKKCWASLFELFKVAAFIVIAFWSFYVVFCLCF